MVWLMKITEMGAYDLKSSTHGLVAQSEDAFCGLLPEGVAGYFTAEGILNAIKMIWPRGADATREFIATTNGASAATEAATKAVTVAETTPLVSATTSDPELLTKIATWWKNLRES